MPMHRVNGVELFIEVAGHGPPLVLVHGSWAELATWDLVVDDLSLSYSVVRYDRRGHGRSGGDALLGTVHDDVADLAGVIDRVGGGFAHVVGSSFGSCIALRLAAEQPGLVRRLAIHEPPMAALLADDPKTAPILVGLQSSLAPVIALLEAGRYEQGAQRFVNDIALGPGVWSTLPEPVRAMFVRNAPTFLGETRDPEGLVIEPAAVERIGIPVLLSTGDQSPPMFAAVADTLHTLVPHLTRHRYPGAGHVPHMTHPGEFVKTVDAFLNN